MNCLFNLAIASLAEYYTNIKVVMCRELYVQQLQEWIGVDVYGECGPLTCGHVLNIQQEYDPLHSNCSQLVNSKYR
jgi:hypothetical protein